MSFLAALVLSTASARIDFVSVTTFESRPALRIALSGAPGRVELQRDGGRARLAIAQARLGPAFPGARRFTWRPTRDFAAPLPRNVPPAFREVAIAVGTTGVDVELSVSSETSVELRRDAHGLILVSRTSAAGAERAPHAATTAPPAASAATQETSTPSASDTAGLARQLFPQATGAAAGAPDGRGTVAELYGRLFPEAAPEGLARPAPAKTGVEPAAGAPLGPFRIRASVDARYVDGDTFLGSPDAPTRDRFLEVGPRVLAETPVGAGRLTMDYKPVLRAFATDDRVNRSSHLASAGLELPVGQTLTLRANDRFVTGTLDTRFVDPGGEYFYGLGRFYRNDADAGASVGLAPRLRLELAGSAGALRFREHSTFFDHDTLSASAGLGFEAAPNLEAAASYVYDTIPRTAERPEAGSRAHSLRVSLDGELTPLLSGAIALGYRRQQNPDAGEGGRQFAGLTVSGVLTRRLAPESLFSLYVSRSTPASAFERNGFYVSTSLQASTQFTLPLAFQLRGGLGYQWNEYRTKAIEIGRPRRDGLLGWFVALRRELHRRVFLSGSYRAEDRRSNVDRFRSESSGLVLQLEYDVLGAPPK